MTVKNLACFPVIDHFGRSIFGWSRTFDPTDLSECLPVLTAWCRCRWVLMSVDFGVWNSTGVMQGSFIHSCAGSGEHTWVNTHGLAEFSYWDVWRTTHVLLVWNGLMFVATLDHVLTWSRDLSWFVTQIATAEQTRNMPKIRWLWNSILLSSGVGWFGLMLSGTELCGRLRYRLNLFNLVQCIYSWTECGRLCLNLISLVWDHRNVFGWLWNWFVIWSFTGLVCKIVI